jgi:hypothetical protein
VYDEPPVVGLEGLLFCEGEASYEKYWKSSGVFKVAEAGSGVSGGDCSKRAGGCRNACSVVGSLRTKGSARVGALGEVGAAPLRHRASR